MTLIPPELSINGRALVGFVITKAQKDDTREAATLGAMRLVAALEYAEQQYARFATAFGSGDCEALLRIRETLGMLKP